MIPRPPGSTSTDTLLPDTTLFRSQLAALAMLGLAIAQRRGLDRRTVALYTRQMAQVPKLVEHTLKLDGQIREWAQRFADKHHALFLGRGPSRSEEHTSELQSLMRISYAVFCLKKKKKKTKQT